MALAFVLTPCRRYRGNAKRLVNNADACKQPHQSVLIYVTGSVLGSKSKILICDSLQVADIEKAERDKMRSKVEAIIGHGINCFVNRQLIYNFPEEIFADAGVMAIEHADFDGIERLALVTGAHQALSFMLSTFGSVSPRIREVEGRL